MPINFYNSAKDNKGIATEPETVLQDIKNEKYGKLTDAIRLEPNKKKRDELKKKLPAVTWSGFFSPTRKKENIQQHNELICMDIDGLDITTVFSLKEKLSQDKYTYACFISPSGNGLKVLYKLEFYPIEGNLKQLEFLETIAPRHELVFFRAIANYLKLTYQIEVDESGKDVSRLCFISSDFKMIWNENAQKIESDFLEKYLPFAKGKEEKKLDKAEKPAPKKTTPGTNTETVSDEKLQEVVSHIKDVFEKLQEVVKFTENKFSYSKGRNNFIHNFACNANRRGFHIEETKSFAVSEFVDYATEDKPQLIATIESAYKNNQNEHGKYARTLQKPFLQKALNAEKRAPSISTGEYNETIKFWYEIEKVDKETGEVKTEVKFDHDGLTWFLANNGFRKLKLGDRGFQFVRMHGARLESVEPEDINNFLSVFLHRNVIADKDGNYNLSDVQDELHEVRKMFKRGIKSYTQTANYTLLPELKPNFLKSDEHKSFYYFENGIVEVTKDEKKFIDYENVKNHVWENDIKKFKISLIDLKETDEAVVNYFLQKAICGNGDEDLAKDVQRIHAMFTTIGYLLSGYKDPTNTKCPVFQDKKVTSGTDAHGGSGKTLTAHIIGKMISNCLIDGKDFSFDSPYPYDSFRPDNKLIVYNDVTKKFPFERLFHKITEDFQYDKRYVDAIIIPHEDSPMHLVTTNYSLVGEGSAFRRRQQIIEFSDYFNDEYTPKDEFEHRFFTDWDEKEWNKFYNFMLHCVQLFRKKGLVAFPAQNVNMNKLIAAAGQELIDWLDEKILGDKDGGVPPLYHIGMKWDRTKIFDQFREEEKRYAKMENSNTFTGWVKQWATIRGLDINKHKNGNNDKSGRVYSWTFTEMEIKK